MRGWLLGFCWCASGDVWNGPDISLVERGKQLRDKFVYPEVMGSRDGRTILGRTRYRTFSRALPGLCRSEILEGAGRWIQQERAEETNALLLEFLGQLR